MRQCAYATPMRLRLPLPLVALYSGEGGVVCVVRLGAGLFSVVGCLH